MVCEKDLLNVFNIVYDLVGQFNTYNCISTSELMQRTNLGRKDLYDILKDLVYRGFIRVSTPETILAGGIAYVYTATSRMACQCLYYYKQKSCNYKKEFYFRQKGKQRRYRELFELNLGNRILGRIHKKVNLDELYVVEKTYCDPKQFDLVWDREENRNWPIM